jgi:hypothetical protein
MIVHEKHSDGRFVDREGWCSHHRLLHDGFWLGIGERRPSSFRQPLQGGAMTATFWQRRMAAFLLASIWNQGRRQDAGTYGCPHLSAAGTRPTIVLVIWAVAALG